MVRIPARKRRKLSPVESYTSDTSPSTLVESPNAPVMDAFVANAARWNLEQDYETRPRQSKKRERENTRLPIKTADGRVEQLIVLNGRDKEDDCWLDSDQEKVSAIDTPVEIRPEKPNLPTRQQILEAKEELARVASLINEDPEEHVGGFRTLAQIAASSNFMVKKLALATQVAVYKDVIPGYRIRPPRELDMTGKVSKEVRRLRSFEQGLVSSYQNFIKELSKCARPNHGDVSEAVASLATVAISCACTLLLAVPHFNFRGDLIKILVNKLSNKRLDSDFLKCCETFEILFRNDEDGTPSLDAVTTLSRMIKSRSYRVHERVLNTFLQLRLLSEFSSKGSQNQIDKLIPDDAVNGKKPKFQKEFRTKKQRKLTKERNAVAKEFKEADAIISHEERDKMQAETLKLVFITYFRILKAGIPSLTGAVLEGLAKYAHLINQDFFGDLLEALKDLTANASASIQTPHDIADQDRYEEEYPVASRSATREALLCIITAFALLEGQDAHKAATSLNLDLSFFTTNLYRSLLTLALNPDLELSAKSRRLPDQYVPSSSPSTLPQPPKINIQTTPALFLRALNSILLPPLAIHSVPPVRIAAFSKQLFISLLHLPEKTAMAVTGLMAKVAKTHRRKIAGMWNTEERKGDGEFDGLREEAEQSNPFASTVWEGEILRLHFCPTVREGVLAVEKCIGEIT